MKHEEHDIQAAIVAWFDLRYAKEKYDLIAIPNGGARSAVTGARLKAEGVRRGVPDLFLAQPRMLWERPGCDSAVQFYAGLWLEIKTPKGRTTPEQEAFMDRQSARGYCCRVARSVDEGIKIIETYLGIK